MFKKVLSSILFGAEVVLYVYAVTGLAGTIWLASHDASLRVSVDYPNGDNMRLELLSPNDRNKKE